LVINKMFNNAEAGYWIGVQYWGNGYCTEALKAIINYGFGTLQLNKIHAHHITTNPASGRVMLKCGMSIEGSLKKHILKNNVYEDIVLYGILRDEFRN